MENRLQNIKKLFVILNFFLRNMESCSILSVRVLNFIVVHPVRK
jgi:hypothetical protein